jgi:hypothetical protein
MKRRIADDDTPECGGASFYVLGKSGWLPVTFLDIMRG